MRPMTTLALSLLAASTAFADAPDFETQQVHQEFFKSGCVELARVAFAPGAATLKEKAPVELSRVAWALGQEPSLKLHIIVHAEAGANAAKALALAKRRAETIADWLARSVKIERSRLLPEARAQAATPPDGCHAAPAYAVNAD